MDNISQLPQPQANLNPTPPIPEPPKTSGWLKWVLLIISAVIISSATTYLILQFQQVKQTPPSQMTQTAPTPTPDPTANWKVYTNAKYGFSLKYPSSWKQIEDSDNVVFVDTIKRQSAEDKILYNGKDRNTDRVSIYIHGDQKNLNDYIKSQNLPGSTLIKNTTFNNLPAIKTLYKGQGINNISIYVINNNKGYSIEYSFEHMNLDDDSLLVPNILSTFKFLDQTSYSCPATEWVDCMPKIVPNESEEIANKRKEMCSQEYIAWAKTNCPGFQGATY